MKPLEGIRVVDLSTMLAGPMTGRILAEWGADVVKVETMNGDAWRKQAGTTMSPCTSDANPNFDMQNLNKRFVALNMRTQAGHNVMMKLLERADVFLTNFRVQALEGMGLTYDQALGIPFGELMDYVAIEQIKCENAHQKAENDDEAFFALLRRR